MRRTLQLLLVIFSCTAMVACTSLRVVADGSEASQRAIHQSQPLLRPGDAAIITTTDGAKFEMKVTAVEVDAIVGVVAGKTDPSSISISQIERIERSEADPIKTALVTILGLVIAGVIIGNALGAKMANSLSAAK